MNDYERIARVIRYLDAHRGEQPDLAILARQAGLSSFHFHRLFVRWAGVTPKDFLQCLTLTHARDLLKKGRSVLDSSLESGLSGPGRLHDLCVRLEAASPGELKSGGAGWTIRAGFAKTPFGDCLLAESPRGICHLSFIEGKNSGVAWAALIAEWPRAAVKRNDAAAKKIAAHIFRPASGQEIRAYVRGTEFQVRVWRALLEIPSGTVTTYGRLAMELAQPKAARAVGTAVGQNSLAYLIPCHRVIRETGLLGGYRWGISRKRILLARESSETQAQS